MSELGSSDSRTDAEDLPGLAVHAEPEASDVVCACSDVGSTQDEAERAAPGPAFGGEMDATEKQEGDRMHGLEMDQAGDNENYVDLRNNHDGGNLQV